MQSLSELGLLFIYCYEIVHMLSCFALSQLVFFNIMSNILETVNITAIFTLKKKVITSLLN